MEYRLTIKNDTIEASVETSDEGLHHVSIGDDMYIMSCSRLSGEQIHLNVNGKIHRVFVSGEGSREVFIDGTSYYVDDADAPYSGSKSGRVRDIPKSVTPPMPAVVVKIMVNRDDDIKKGDGVIVVSAMKLETTISAPYDGIVKSINVSEGEKVMPGQLLVDIEEKITDE